MADFIKFFLIFVLFSAAKAVSATPVLDVATLTGNKGTNLDTYFRYIQPGTRQYTPEQALQAQPWLSKKQQNPDNFAGETWLKLTLSNSADKAKEMVLVQSNPQIYSFTLWQKSTQQNTFEKRYTLGLKYPFKQRPIEHRLFVMPITIEAGEKIELIINADVAGYDLLSKTTLWLKDSFLQKENLNDFWQVFYFGAVFVMLCYNLVIYLLTRESSYLLYSGFVGSSLGMFFVISSWPFQYFWPNTPEITNPLIYFFMSIMLVFAGAFTSRFLMLKQRYPTLKKTIYFFCIAIFIEYIIYVSTPFDETYAMIRAIMATSVPLYFLNLSAGILVWRKFNVIEAAIYVIAWSLLIVITIAALIHETWLPFIPIPVTSTIQAAHLFEVVLLSMALASRINRLKRQEHIAEAKAATQTQFLARMSHEIRTPMNGIVAIADLLKQQPDNNKNAHYIDIINNSAKALSLIINDVLDYSKISAGKLQLKPKPCALRQLIRETMLLFELPSQQKNLDLSFHIGQDIADTVIIDDDRLRQILINLLSNAVKYTEKGFVSLSVSLKQQQLCFNVCDSGCGISQTDYQKVFSAFEQGDNNNLGRESSTGLGLAICKELVSLMQGHIDVKSSNKGSTFWFTVPYQPATKNADNHSDNLYKDTSAPQLPEMFVLVAEDNIINQQVIDHLLQNLSIRYHLVENGRQAVDYFKEHHNAIDAVLMDCEMPVTDGFTASLEIRAFEQQHRLEKTPIIALTAHTLHQEMQHCLDVGMDKLLVKPVTSQMLYESLQELQATPEDEALVKA